MNRFRAAVHDAMQARAGKAKAQTILAEAGLSHLWPIYEMSDYALPYEEATIRDIVGKLVKYGSVSEKALGFAGSLFEKIGKRAEIAAQRAAELAAASPCPSGRVRVTGTILSVKTQDSPWGVNVKMLVRAESGFKVWCTLPASSQANKGDSVAFTATLEPSKDDAKFGFGSRPAKFEILQAAQA